MKYAIVINNIVDNIIVWDGEQALSFAENETAVELLSGEWCDIGCTFDESANPRFFIPPILIEEA